MEQTNMNKFKKHCLSCVYYYDGREIGQVIPENVRSDMLSGNTPQRSSFGIPDKPSCYKALNDSVFQEYGAENSSTNRVKILAEAKCPIYDGWRQYRNGVRADIAWQEEQTLKIRCQNKTLIFFNIALVLLTVVLAYLTYRLAISTF